MVRSMRGQNVDMARLAAENGDKIALGNASMNARGDIVGPGGAVVKTQAQVVREYNAKHPNAVKQVALRDIQREVYVSPEEAVVNLKPQEPKKRRKLAE